MAILKQDVKLMKSQRLTDFEDGGGRMIGQEVEDGVANNLFPDISRLDRVYGRVSLRKGFLSVQTANSDFYYGAHAIVSNPPADDNVHTTLFTTGSPVDLRAGAKDRVESYVAMASEFPWRPSNDQLVGQRAINLFATPGTPRIENGETIVLKNSNTGSFQYVKVNGVDAVEQTFIIPSGSSYITYRGEILTLNINNPLQETFPGIEPTPLSTKAITRIHRTVVADASTYFGVKKTIEELTPGNFEIKVNSIYNQLVPTSQIETPLLDQFMNGAHTTMVRNGVVGSLTFSGSRNQTTNVIFLPQGVLPGSLTLTVSDYTFVDHKGVLKIQETGGADGGFSGTVDYATGQVDILSGANWSSTVVITATPALPLMQSFNSFEIPVTLETRSYNYAPMLTDPLPTPGGIYISYMSQGKWYELRDDGKGVFSGYEDGMGTGSVNYGTGSCVITLGALPDVDSSIIVQWGHDIEVDQKEDTAITIKEPIHYIDLGDEILDPSSVVITWELDGLLKTATVSGAGLVIGDATGRVSPASGDVYIQPNIIPPSATVFNIDYNIMDDTPLLDEDKINFTMTPTVTGFIVSGQYSTDIFRQKTVRIEYVEKFDGWSIINNARTRYVNRLVVDDGAGNLYDVATREIVGVINYASGEFSFTGLREYEYKYVTSKKSRTWYGRSKTSYTTHIEPRISTVSNNSLTIMAVKSTAPASTWLPRSAAIEAPPLKIDVSLYSSGTIVPRSIIFTLESDSYYDDGMGSIYKNRSATTGVGTLVGGVNYSTGEVSLNTHGAITDPVITLNSMLIRGTILSPDYYVFRTPGAPVRDGSMYLRGTTEEGELITATTETTGVITSDNMRGEIDHTTGVVRVEFGRLEDPAPYLEEDWYDVENLEGGLIWVSKYVIPETAQYNCVLFSFIPLDPELLGIEPTRLPSDGRVPIFKPGDVVVVHHTGTHVCAASVSGTTEDVGRLRLALVEVYDANGLYVDNSYYTVDLALGTVTFGTVTGLGFQEPLQIKHRIEDMLLLTDVQINGRLKTAGAISHTFPVTETQVSSALLFGDLASRVNKLFSQVSWTNVWSDSQIGNNTSGVYNDLQFPIQVLNNGAIEERWRVTFISSTSFTVTGETLGQVANASGNYTFTTSADCVPLNLLTGEPYFTIPYQGWGAGWATGNVLRFNTLAANAPMWIARTTMAGPVEEPEDQFILQLRGDAN